MGRILNTAVFLSVLLCGLTAQEKPTAPAKPEPGTRRPEVARPRVEARSQQSGGEGRQAAELPKIDLPEFVITGTATIDLPRTEKVQPDSHMGDTPLPLADPLAAERDRGTVEFAAGGKLDVQAVGPVAQYGKILASIGTHFTPVVSFWIGQRRPEYFYLGDAHYESSKGYAPYTNRSEGAVEAKGGVLIHAPSPWLDQATGTGTAGYGSQTYRFFGSSTPSLTRTISRFALGGELSSSTESPLPYDLGLRFSSDVVADSSADVTDLRFDLTAETSIPLWSTSVLGRIQFTASSLTGSSSASLPFLEVTIGSRRLSWNRFFAQVSASAYLAKGMLDQNLTKVYPNATVGYQFPASTVLSVSYAGGVRYNALADFIRAHPYLSGASLIRHSDVPVDVSGVLETDWDEVWRTRLSARYQSVRDYPLYTEGGMGGIWSTVYQGTSSLMNYQADLFANFDSNSYFALTAAWNVTKNSTTQLKIPYIPEFQITGMYTRTILPGLSVSPWLSFVGRRAADLSGGARLPSYLLTGLKADYSGLGSLHLFVDVQNVTDKKYEEWRGYRAAPFLISVGTSYHW
jgi:hypothetical protein